MNWQKVIEAARAEAERQGIELTVESHSERPDRHLVLLTLEPKPPTLGVQVSEQVGTVDRVR